MQASIVSVVICTRNRGDSLVPTLKSILANQTALFELIVVDQSTNEATEQAVKIFHDDSRLRYLRSDTIGLGRSRNIALGMAQGEVVLMTDDDCEVPIDWVQRFASVFAERENVAMAFCNTRSAPGNWENGYIPVYERTGDLLVTSSSQRRKVNPIGAGMAVRRAVIQAIGGFDENMGAGGTIPAYEEDDLAYRCLVHGYQVFETDRTYVFHYGFRTTQEHKALTYRNYYAIGGGLAKFLKCRQWRVLMAGTQVLWTTIVVPFFGSLIRLKIPRVVSRVTGFVNGFAKGLRMPVDTETLLFRR